MDITNYELYMIIELLKECNFNCEYCFNRSYRNSIKFKTEHIINKVLRKKKKLGNIGIDKFVTNIGKLNKECLILLAGGEPFLFPKFTELCKKLTRKNYITVITNLSHPSVYKFADEVNPNKVKRLFCSLHIIDLEKYGLVKDFIKKVKYLENKGFKTEILYTMYPPLFKRFLKDYKFFKSHGITISTKCFRGLFKSKIYPQSYSKEQRGLLLKYSRDIDKKILELNNFNFKGKKCNAGKSTITILNDGKVIRCHGEHKNSIGNLIDGNIKLFKNAKLCEAKICPCPNLGIRYTTNQS